MNDEVKHGGNSEVDEGQVQASSAEMKDAIPGYCSLYSPSHANQLDSECEYTPLGSKRKPDDPDFDTPRSPSPPSWHPSDGCSDGGKSDPRDRGFDDRGISEDSSDEFCMSCHMLRQRIKRYKATLREIRSAVGEGETLRRVTKALRDGPPY